MFEPTFADVPNTNLKEITHDWEFEVGGRTVPVPAFVRFDGSSIPGFAQPIIGKPYDKKYEVPAFKHDYCFLTHCCTFVEANNLFYKDLRDNKVNIFKAMAKYTAVSTVGYYHWCKKDVKGLKELRALLDARPDAGYYKLFIGRKI